MFYKTNSEYGKGIELNEYKGRFFIHASKEGSDGKVYSDWAFPQDRDRKPKDKAIPVKVELGDRPTAIKALRYLLSELGDEAGEPVDDDIRF